mgnify:CR=1 FL=1
MFDIRKTEADINGCFVIRLLNRGLEFFRKLIPGSLKNSFILSNLDYLITAVCSLVFISSLFASSTVIGIFIWLSFVLFLVKILLEDYRISVDFTDVLILVWFFAMFLSTAFASLLPQSLWGLSKMVTYLMFYCVMKHLISEDFRRGYYFIFLLCAVISFESLYVIHQNFVGVEEISGWQDTSHLNAEQVLTRVYGTLQPFNPNLLAGYLLSGFPILAGGFFSLLKDKRYRMSFVVLLMLVCCALGILFSGCRGAYVGLLVEFVVLFAIFSYFVWNDFRDKKYLKKVWIASVLISIFGVIFLVASSEALQARIMSIFAMREDSSNSFRMNVYQSSFRMFLDNFWVGIGIGNKVFREIYGLYMRSGFDALGAYSVFLETAVETGIIGLSTLLAFIGFMIVSAVKNLVAKIVSFSDKILFALILTGVVGMMTHGFVDTIWFRPQVQVLFWFMSALFVVVMNKNKEGKDVA